MENNKAEALEVPLPCKVKVQRSICSELQKFIDRISNIILVIESARPNCASAVQSLCSLHFTLDKAKLVIQHCCESSKLYLVITADRIISRCEKIRSALELHLTQIQNVVPILLAAKISEILRDLGAAEFSLEFTEDEARKAIVALLEKDFPILDSTKTKIAELGAVQTATMRLKITSPSDLLEEKAALKQQLDKVTDRDHKEKELLKYILYLLMKYRKLICQLQPECHDPSFNHDLAAGCYAVCQNQVDDFVNTEVSDSKPLSS